MGIIGSGAGRVCRLVLYLNLNPRLDTVYDAISLRFLYLEGREPVSYMSKGYTMALANTAPVAPAIAPPHGGNAGFPALSDIKIGASFEWSVPLKAHRSRRCRGHILY